MIVVTIDTNLLASGFVDPEPPPGQVLVAWRRGLLLLLISEHILSELTRTFQQPYFARRLSPERQAAALALLRRQASITPLATSVQGVATHPEDGLVLATTLSGNAQFLVTGDYKLIRLKQYHGIILVTAHEFLAMLPGLVDQGN